VNAVQLFEATSESEGPPRAQLMWRAYHLGDHARPVQTWQQVRQLIASVGTTEWPWLAIESVPTKDGGRRAVCIGFADILAVEVFDWDHKCQKNRVQRLGIGPPDARWVDVGTVIGRCPKVRRSQVLDPYTAALGFRSWLELGHVHGFTSEEV
jgi:hypothetical protein